MTALTQERPSNCISITSSNGHATTTTTTKLDGVKPNKMKVEKIAWTERVAKTEILPIKISSIKFQLSESSSHPYEDPKPLAPEDVETERALQQAVKLIKTSNIPVAFPTETVYGLGADAKRSEMVRNIFAAKDRFTDNPLIVHVGSLKQARALMEPSSRVKGMVNGHSNADEPPGGSNGITNGYSGNGHGIPEVYLPLIEKYWPGPLTILLPLPKDTDLSPYVYGNQKTIGVRMPDHPVALYLALAANTPIAAPSANRSGLPSPTTALHVARDLDRRVELILNGGSCNVGVESTVVDGLSEPPVILRPGGVSLEQIRTCGGIWKDVVVHREKDAGNGASGDNNSEAPRAPGMKYKHYSPNCLVKLYLPGATPPSVEDLVQSAYGRDNSKVGILRSKTWKADLGKGVPGNLTIIDRDLGRDGETISKTLFAALRDMDDEGVTTVHVEGIAEDAEGLAVMNRLTKAASTTIGPPKV